MTDELLKLLAGVGHVLDTPGALLRGALAGNPGSRASGREMLESWGLPENEPGLDMGDVLGFGTEAVLDPLGWIPPVNAAKLAMQPSKMSRILGITPELGALPTRQIEEMLGVSPEVLSPLRAEEAYRDFRNSLSPEESDALQAFDEKRGAIEDLLESPGARLDRPLVIPGTRIPPLHTKEGVEREIAPYLDSAIARSSAPTDLMAYQSAPFLGFNDEVTPENAEQFVGRMIGSRNYPLISSTPFNSPNYGDASYNPGKAMLNLLIPEGSQAATKGGGAPLLLPRQSEFSVEKVVDRPVARINGFYHPLDPTGRPFPLDGMYMTSDVWDQSAYKDWMREVKQSGKVPEYVPPEILRSGWQEHVENPEFQKNIIARLVGRSPIPDAKAPYRRLTIPELQQALMDAKQHPAVVARMNIVFPNSDSSYFDNLIRRIADQPRLANSDQLRDTLKHFFALSDDTDIANLNRSIPLNPRGRVHVTGEDPSRHMEIDPMAISDFAAEHLTPGVRVKFYNTSAGPAPEKLNPHFFGTVKNQVNDVVYDAEAFKKAKELESEIREREHDLFFRGATKNNPYTITPQPKPILGSSDDTSDELILEDFLESPDFTEEDIQDAMDGLEYYSDKLHAHEVQHTRPVAVELEDGRTVTFLPRGKSDPLWGATAYLTPEQALRADNLRVLKGGPLYTPLLAALLGGSGAVLSKLDHED